MIISSQKTKCGTSKLYFLEKHTSHTEGMVFRTIANEIFPSVLNQQLYRLSKIKTLNYLEISRNGTLEKNALPLIHEESWSFHQTTG